MTVHAGTERMAELVRLATLAPSSHNTQPWRFEVDESGIRVRADTDRWLRVADRDRRELFISLGCAVENLVTAARNRGLMPEVALEPDPDTEGIAAAVTLAAGAAEAPQSGGLDLFAQIERRRTSHAPFDGRELAAGELDALRAVSAGHGVDLELLEDRDSIRGVADLSARADQEQFADPAWRRELGRWIGSGALGARWPVSRVAQVVVTHFDMGESTGRKNAALIAGSSSIGILWTHTDTRDDHVRVGRAYERIALAASAMGIATHPVSQALEVPRLKSLLAALLPVSDGVPQHVFRMGHADDEASATPRRRPEEMIEPARRKE